ncbi:MAG TPA: hypothetical protein VFE16_08810 [Candidatus Cybelea sp.]|nr:hypothetical protein [Candidatus Cybelea sp.]
MAALESLPWDDVPEVTLIRPIPRKHIDFFPGHRGHIGARFPVGGIMVVGNNFSSLKGWGDYIGSPDVASPTSTWRKVRLMIEGSGLSWEDFWFTNYCFGVMDRKKESYDFPRRIIKALEFESMFSKSVAAMRPRLIVSLGRLAAKHLRTDYDLRGRVDERVIGGHPARLLAAVHPSAWTWNGKGFRDEDFVGEGARIRYAASRR